MNLIKQLTRFGGIGVLLALLSISIYYLTLELWHWPLYPTYCGVYLVAVFISYTLNAKYTFKKRTNFKSLIHYYIVYFLGLLFGLFLLYVGRESIVVSNFWLTVATIIPRTLFTFFLSRKIVFKQAKTDS